MAKIPKIPAEDLHLITELLKTLSIVEVAEKWEVSIGEIRYFLRANDISLPILRKSFRMGVLSALSGRVNVYDLMEDLNMCQSSLRSFLTQNGFKVVKNEVLLGGAQ